MQIVIERNIQINQMTQAQASRLKHIASFTPPSYMNLKRKDKKASARHPTIKLGRQNRYSLSIPRGVSIQWLLNNYEGVAVDDCTVSIPMVINCAVKPQAKQVQAFDAVVKQRVGVLLVGEPERHLLGVMLAAHLGQRCMVIVPYAAHVKRWCQVIEQATGERCGVVTNRHCSEGKRFTVAVAQTLTRLKGDGASDHCPVTHERLLTPVEHFLCFGLVIVDACYTKMQAVYDAVNQLPARYRVGLAEGVPEYSNDRVLIDAALGGVVASTLAAQQ